MTSELPRPPPQSSVQAAAGAVSDVTAGLKQQPALLAIVVLNVIAIAAGTWFMSRLIEISQGNMRTIMTVCFDGNHAKPP